MGAALIYRNRLRPDGKILGLAARCARAYECEWRASYHIGALELGSDRSRLLGDAFGLVYVRWMELPVAYD
jgi:hypothetical protein